MNKTPQQVQNINNQNNAKTTYSCKFSGRKYYVNCFHQYFPKDVVKEGHNIKSHSIVGLRSKGLGSKMGFGRFHPRKIWASLEHYPNANGLQYISFGANMVS